MDKSGVGGGAEVVGGRGGQGRCGVFATGGEDLGDLAPDMDLGAIAVFIGVIGVEGFVNGLVFPP